MWIPAAAFAGLVGIAVVQHFRHATTDTQMAGAVAETDGLRTAEAAKAALHNPEPASPLKHPQPAKPAGTSAIQQAAPERRQTVEVRKLEDKKLVAQRDFALGSAASPVVMFPGLAEGTFHGAVAAKTQASPYGGPSALNQFQQQNPPPTQQKQQNMSQQPEQVQFDAANRGVVAGTAPQAAQTVTVQPEAQMAKPAPAPASQLSEMPMISQGYEISSANVAGISKMKLSLPNGVSALSVATIGRRTIALDTKGALYLTEDHGTHWQPIPSQWTGQAVLVRRHPVGAPTAALQLTQTACFELMNDKLQIWFSCDGKTWISDSLRLK